MSDIATRIRENLAEIRGRIADAAIRGGRSADRITLVAVTKAAGEPAIRALVAEGCRLLGESRPQQLWARAASLADLAIQWHMIGHLQRNKVRRTLPLVEFLQAADSMSLIEAVDQVAAGAPFSQPFRAPVLIEVNVSGDIDKHGFDPRAVEPCLGQLARLEHVEVRGLMCMASLDGGQGTARSNFSALRELRDRLRRIAPRPSGWKSFRWA